MGTGLRVSDTRANGRFEAPAHALPTAGVSAAETALQHEEVTLIARASRKRVLCLSDAVRALTVPDSNHLGETVTAFDGLRDASTFASLVSLVPGHPALMEVLVQHLHLLKGARLLEIAGKLRELAKGDPEATKRVDEQTRASELVAETLPQLGFPSYRTHIILPKVELALIAHLPDGSAHLDEIAQHTGSTTAASALTAKLQVDGEGFAHLITHTEDRFVRRRLLERTQDPEHARMLSTGTTDVHGRRLAAAKVPVSSKEFARAAASAVDLRERRILILRARNQRRHALPDLAFTSHDPAERRFFFSLPDLRRLVLVGLARHATELGERMELIDRTPPNSRARISLARTVTSAHEFSRLLEDEPLHPHVGSRLAERFHALEATPAEIDALRARLNERLHDAAGRKRSVVTTRPKTKSPAPMPVESDQEAFVRTTVALLSRLQVGIARANLQDDDTVARSACAALSTCIERAHGKLDVERLPPQTVAEIISLRRQYHGASNCRDFPLAMDIAATLCAMLKAHL